jgi:uncharacterized protein YheU (UPF0270 family)
VIIHPDQLSPETLRALVEEFVTRHGAVQGHTDTPVESMIDQVLAQLRSGRAVIVFDEEEETASIVTKQDLRDVPS